MSNLAKIWRENSGSHGDRTNSKSHVICHIFHIGRICVIILIYKICQVPFNRRWLYSEQYCFVNTTFASVYKLVKRD